MKIKLALCKKTFHTQCIVFFASKKATHRMKLLFGLNGNTNLLLLFEKKSVCVNRSECCRVAR